MFSDTGNDEAVDARWRPASEKRQGRKSRSVVQRRSGGALWGFGDKTWGAELGLERLARWVCGTAWTHFGHQRPILL